MGLDMHIGIRKRVTMDTSVNKDIGHWDNDAKVLFDAMANISDNYDNCIQQKLVEIDPDDLAEFKYDCNQVLSDNSLAEKIVPASCFSTTRGKYDEKYFTQLEKTVKIIEETLEQYSEADELLQDPVIYFIASW